MNGLKNAYLNRGYHLTPLQDAWLVSLSAKQHPLFIAISVNESHPLSFEEVKPYYMKAIELGEQSGCHHYLLFNPQGFDESCHPFSDTTLRLVSMDYLEDLANEHHVELLAHNQKAYEELHQLLSTQRFAAIEQATGTGKTFIALKLLYDYHHQMKWVIAPSHFILDKLKHLYGDSNIQYFTYQKLAMMSEEERETPPTPALIIFDELHRLGAKLWGEAGQKIIDFFPEAKVVGFTATPIRYLDDQRDMIEEKFEKRQAFPLTLADAVAKRILPSPLYISALYTLQDEIDQYKKQLNRGLCDEMEKQQLLEELNQIRIDWTQTNGVSDLFAKYMPQTSQTTKWLVFCENIEHLYEIKPLIEEWVLSAFPMKTLSTYSIYTGCFNQTEQLTSFMNSQTPQHIDLLLCVDKFNEGVHIPGITGIVMLRKTASPIIYYQQLGRALATDNQQPIIFDLVNNFDQLIHHDFFGTLKERIRELSKTSEEQDLPYLQPQIHLIDKTQPIQTLFQQLQSALSVSWDDMYQELVNFEQKFGHTRVHLYLSEYRKLGLWVKRQRFNFSAHRLTSDRIDRLNAIDFEWTILDSTWNETFAQLLDFKQTFGHLNVPRKGETTSLAKWIVTQRGNYHKGTLSPSRIEKLESIGFVWSYVDNAWEKQYQELKQLYEEEGVGVSLIPYPNLSIWTRRQREIKDRLSLEKIEKLNQIGFLWNPLEEKWWEKYQEATKYYQKHGHINVDAREGELGRWIQRQRKAYQNHQLTDEKVRLLNQLKMSWNPLEDIWQARYQELIDYQQKNGSDVLALAKIDNNHKQLMLWCRTQRKKMKEGTLSDDKIQLLNEANFIWDPLETLWLANFEKSQTYYQTYGHLNIPKSDKTYQGLYNWLTQQRKFYREGKLSESRIEKLETLGVRWNPKEA